MGFFSSKKETVPEEVNFWKKIETENDLEQAIKDSDQHKVILFKHSTRCGVSRTALKMFEKEVSESNNDFEFWYLDLLKNRDLSNKIAENFQVIHQSPQVLVLKNGAVIYHASHHSIHLSDIEKA